MNGLAELRSLACDQIRASHPNLPEAAISPGRYNDKTHNGLIHCIVDYINFMGGSATKVSTTGRKITIKTTEVKGSGQEIWIPGTTRNGTPDIIGAYHGIPLFIEAKVGRDVQSDKQKEKGTEVTAAGGLYYLARDFLSFYEWILTIKKEGPAKEPSIF